MSHSWFKFAAMLLSTAVVASILVLVSSPAKATGEPVTHIVSCSAASKVTFPITINAGVTLNIPKANSSCSTGKVNFSSPQIANQGGGYLAVGTTSSNEAIKGIYWQNIADTTTFLTTTPGTYIIWFRGASSSNIAEIVITVNAAATAFTATPKPTISDTTPEVGQTLTATTTNWDPVASMSYQWFAGGVAISGAVTDSFTVTAAQAGKTITVKATGTLTGYATTTVESDPTSVVPTLPFTTTTLPTISGNSLVGSTLTASVSGWDPSATFAYSWLADGVPISGATTSTFTLTSDQVGQKISVRVTGSSTGYTPTEKTSVETSAVSLPTGLRITYNANAASNGGTVPTDSATYTMNDQVTVLGAGTLARTDYTFDGWNTKADGTGTDYTGGAKLTMGSSDLTLYAQWVAVQYTISYQVGSTATNVASKFSIEQKNVTLPLAPVSGDSGFEAGKKFKGWYTDAALTQSVGAPGAPYTPTMGNKTLYGACEQYTLSFRASSMQTGGSSLGNPCWIEPISFTWGSSITLPALPEVCKSMKLKEWLSANNTLSSSVGNAGTTYTPSGRTPGDVILYANYTPMYLTTWQVALETDTNTQSYAAVGELVTPPVIPVYTNKHFAWWGKISPGSPAVKTTTPFVQADTKNTDMEAYCTYWLYFDDKGGVGGPADFSVENTCKNVDFNENLPAEEPTKVGYSFAGWNLRGTNWTYTQKEDGFITIFNYLYNFGYRLDAQWTARSNTVKYATGTTDPAVVAPTDGTFTSGQALTLPSGLSRPGYTFLGWADQNGSLRTGSFTPEPTASGVLTLTGQWAANRYTVKFDTLGGSSVADKTFETGGSFTVPAAPSRQGYAFKGWFDATTGGVQYSGTVTPSVLKGFTLYARWELVVTPLAAIPSTPVATLSLNVEAGARITGATVTAKAEGLAPEAPYEVELRSEPQIIARGIAVNGIADVQAPIPPGLQAGWHTLTFRSTAFDGSPVTRVVYFEINASGILLEKTTLIPTELAQTGSQPPTAFGSGLWLIGAGLVAMVIARRSRQTAQTPTRR